ncbi:MAG TPA: glycosyltransferase [Opitutaceae bacterium]|nr:glycosyltransferase [Opitutaceae bacterium]
MKIAVVSRANAPGGGASRIAEDLARGILHAGHQATHFCGQIIGSPDTFQRPLFGRDRRSRLVRTLQHKTQRLGIPTLLALEERFLFRNLFREFEAVHFHDHANTISMRSIAHLSRWKRTFFTAHDFHHLTGGCIYPLSCARYKTHCGECPQRRSIGKYDFTRYNQAVNRKAAQYSSIHYIYPSDWLRREAEAHLRWKIPGITLPNGFDPAPYRFVDRRTARQQLGIDPQRKVIAISAHYLADPRKGTKFALSAVRACADLKPLVILIGNPIDSLERHLPGIDFWSTGLVESRVRMGQLFAAADLFLFSSLQDNLPITIQESMSAATPVIGFATGGVPEMIEHGHDGFLVPTGDQSQLDAALRTALTSADLNAWGQNARAYAAAKYAPRDFIDTHLKLYAGSAKNSTSTAAATRPTTHVTSATP